MYSCQMEETSTEEREALIMEHLPQVRMIARRIHERLPESVSIDDLISNGTVGLISAIDNFDSAQNVKLKTYAEYRIRGAILDGLRNLDWAPRQKRRMGKQIEAAIAAAQQRLGRAPTEEEIAAQLGIPIHEYREWLVDTEGLQIADLEIAGSGEDGFSLLKFAAADDSQQPSRILERAELERVVAQAIENIPKTERTVLSLYYFEELNLREIAQVMDLHLSRISQLKTQAILRLRTVLAKRWPGSSGIQ
ncbi:MAG: polymerase, sigma 28 subunit, FliA/WhiG family [Bryobacterales bacterium]|nr:polymerase, sigma 28 subunit, FliA/WhiG family [Bryobacterales bacterium]